MMIIIIIWLKISNQYNFLNVAQTKKKIQIKFHLPLAPPTITLHHVKTLQLFIGSLKSLLTVDWFVCSIHVCRDTGDSLRRSQERAGSKVITADEVTGNEQRWREKNGRGRVLQWRRVGEGTSSQMLKLNRFLYHVDCHRDKEQQLNTEQVTLHWGAQPLVCGVVVGGTWKFVVLPPLSNKFATLASLVWVPAPPSPPTKSGWLTWGFIPLIPLWNPVNPLVI